MNSYFNNEQNNRIIPQQNYYNEIWEDPELFDDFNIIANNNQVYSINQNNNETTLPESYLLHKYNINPVFSNKLQFLSDFKICLILDDSGSMNLNSTTNGMQTRWNELIYFTNIFIDLASTFNTNGCDCYFLNSAPIKNIINSAELIKYFTVKPQGITPLTNAFKHVLKDNGLHNIFGKKILIVIITDGMPTDQNGNMNIDPFVDCLKQRPDHVFTQIVLMGNDYLKLINNSRLFGVHNFNVLNSYQNEFLKVKTYSNNQQSQFSYGDFVAKSFLNSIFNEYPY